MSKSRLLLRVLGRRTCGLLLSLIATVAQGQTRILFIGNSFTHGKYTPVLNYNAAAVVDENYGLPPGHPRQQTDPTMPGPWGGVPGIFKKMADQLGRPYEVHLEVVSAATLTYHYTNAAALAQAGPWDQVVLQESSTQPLPVARGGDPVDFMNYATRLEQAVHAGSPAARVYLFQTWPRADMTYPAGQMYSGWPIDSMAQDLRTAYVRLAARNPRMAAVAPVGDAWLRAIQAGAAERNPYAPTAGTLNLWAIDNMHASKWGSYLAACVLLAQLTGLDPRQLGPAEQAAVALDISGPTAAVLQQVAFEQVLASGPGTLPVVLTALAARRQAGGIWVRWATASEMHSDRFEVQRSADGVAFATVATVPAQGTAFQPRSYAVFDAAAPAGGLYYRLRQVDTDGTVTFSPVVAVGAEAAGALVVFPNPTPGLLLLAGPGATQYRVCNALGQPLRQALMPAGQAAISVADLPAGAYLLELETPAGRVVRRFVRE
jgi:hypothetical protein